MGTNDYSTVGAVRLEIVIPGWLDCDFRIHARTRNYSTPSAFAESSVIGEAIV
jgi:hypothetical protein